jgi:hypothetical protein
MLARYGLAQTSSLYSQVVFDPIFTPLFTAILGPGIAIGASGVTTTTLAAAIATTSISAGIIIR